MVSYCFRCRGELNHHLHFCGGYRGDMTVLDPRGYLEYQRTSNPLDRLTMGDWMKIDRVDEEDLQRRVEEQLERENDAYFLEPLGYRIEFQVSSPEVGFQGIIESSAVIVEGPTEDDWGIASEFINGLSSTAILFLRESEVYRAQLVSYNSEGRKYVWAVKRLDYNPNVGWGFSDWS